MYEPKMSTGGLALACGPLSAFLQDGDLFDVRWHGVEVAQRIYVAVRDESWNTIPAAITDLRLRRTSSQAVAEFDAQHRHGDIDFSWHGSIRLEESGLLVFQMRGRALSSFRYCKIGFNVHHGQRAHAGRTFRCRTEAGEYAGSFEADLQPQLVRDGTLTAMTPHYDQIEIDLDGALVRMEFLGDRFEMQDHRNWIDANWKSYGTPLEFGFPMDLAAGAELFQEVRLHVSGPGVAADFEAVNELSWAGTRAGNLPMIGHLIREQPDAGQLQLLRELRPSHLRIDLHPGEDLDSRLADGQQLANALGARLEVAVHLRVEEPTADARAMAQALATVASSVVRILVLAETQGFSAFRGACPPELSDALIEAIGDRLSGVAIVSGTPQFFVDINRDRPDYARIDGIVFAANPQVHACDSRSIMQNAQAIADVVHFARRLYGKVDVVLSPVDLIGFGGPFPAGPQPIGDRPANEDSRQSQPFCAAWTLAALAAMTEAEVTATTLFELVGPRGLLDGAGAPFEVFRLLALIGAHRGVPVRLLRSTDPDRLVGLAFIAEGGLDLLVANLTDEGVDCRLPDGASLRLGPYAVEHVRDAHEHGPPKR